MSAANELERLRAERDALIDEVRTLQGDLDEFGEAQKAWLRFRRERDTLKGAILDIDAHATPYGDIPDEPGYVGTYLVTAGSLHRALGKIGHTAPKCQAEAERDALKAELAEHEKRVRERVAEEILADVAALFAARIGADLWEAAYRAAYIARGEAS
jgi:hypothetical protein